MARWGEGDPRWLVEDRPDATNVNNWHWTEKNASNWSKNKLTELLVGLKIDSPIGVCEITEMSKCDGDAAVNNRKAKLIFFYEWAIELKWKGTCNDANTPVTGTFEILNLSEEHEIKDVDVVVNIDTHDPKTQQFKEFMINRGIEVVKCQLLNYLHFLKEEFSKGVILPTKEQTVSSDIKAIAKQPKQLIIANENKINMKGVVTDVSELNSTEVFKCRAEDFYKILTTKELVQAFTQGDCVLHAVEGGKFELYGGNVQGQFMKLVPNQTIRQKWRFKTWPEGHYSDVTIEIRERSDSTEVIVSQKGIPTSEFDRTKEGWKRYYWDTIKRIFGFGAILF